MTCRRINLDLFDKSEESTVGFYDNKGREIGIVSFIPGVCKFDINTGNNIIAGNDITYHASSYYDEDDDYKYMCELVPKYMLIEREIHKNLHYAV